MRTTPHEPVAIVGMACRFPGGADSPAAYWELLREGRDATGELPPGRWDSYAARGGAYAAAVRGATRAGAFLDDVSGFDAGFFGILPREAALMDPQQRIVLELSWEALEHAGISPAGLRGGDAGVFMGVGADDYGRTMLEDLPAIEAWSGIGGAYCGVANRVSHVLDLRGPSIAVDTACSSSLVSIHLAAQALRAGECPVALAGGVLVIAAPGLSLVLDAAGATSPDGRCKSFDEGADGYGRGEGAGVVVLKRLADARRDGDRVLAVLRGSAVRQDGHTNGIMAPNGRAQAHLMRRACAAAGVDPADLDYVEAHGTGTPAGDPLELGAMSEVYGGGRAKGHPLLIGSAKTNIGHLEAAAGVAGVIKTVLALRHGTIPPSLNLTTPTSAIDWAGSGLRVVTEETPWPETGRPRLAGVSGYGYGGTIAHLVLERGDPETAPEPADGPGLYPLSGASRAAVTEFAHRLADRLDAEPLATADVGHTLAHRRAHLAERAVVNAADRRELTERLRDLAGSAAAGSVVAGAERGAVWVFSGHGSQWIGMARDLLDTEPVFTEVLDRVAVVFGEEMGLSPRAVILDDARQPVDVVQPMIFAVQAALTALWRSWGLRPAAVLGHSVGEIAAAVAAGVLTLEQGARLVCRRSVLLREVAGRGAMALAALPAEEAERRLGGRADVSVAVAASTGSAVISGDAAAVGALAEAWRADGVTVRAVDSDVAFHSAHMDPLLERLALAAADLPPAAAAIPVYGTALGDPRAADSRDGAYWAANLRNQVRFAQAVTASADDGYRLFLEVSPHPVVEHSIVETLEALGLPDAFVTHSLRRGRPGRETLAANLGLLYCHGADVDWSAQWPSGGLADLPTTAWRHTPYWLPEPEPGGAGAAYHDPASHTLLGGRVGVNATSRAYAWLTRLDRASRPYPGDHPVRDVEIIPAAVLVNTFRTAAASVLPAGAPPADLVDVALRVPVSLTSPRELQVVLQDGALRLSSRTAGGPDPDDGGWITHTVATAAEPAPPGEAAEPVPAAGEELAPGFVVERLTSLGVGGMGFDWEIESARRGENALVVTVRAYATASWAPVLDAAMSAGSVAFPGPPTLRMPAAIGRVTLADVPPAEATVTVRLAGDDTVEVTIAGPDGRVAGRLSALRYAVLDGDVGAVTSPRRLVHRIEWVPLPAAAPGAEPRILLVGPDSALLGRLTERFGAAGVPFSTVTGPALPSGPDLAGRTVLVVPPAGPAGEVAGAAAWLLAETARHLAADGGARLWCVTQGVRESAGERALGHAPLWGLGRIIGAEHPGVWGGVIDIGDSPLDVPRLLEILRTARGEDVIVVRDGQASIPRLATLTGEPTRPPMTCRPEGTYLVTGGLGALGLEVAQWLATRGARRIVLAGRSTPPPRDAWDGLTDPGELARVAAIRGLEARGVTVATVAVDIADAEAAAKLLSPAVLGLPPIRGVVHAAGVVDNRMIRDLDEESLRRVLRPKVTGGLVLNALFPPGSVDFLVFFSSSGQLLGLPGQAAYGAANAFLDALAEHRRAAGDTAATSLGWTSWRGLGMSTSSAVIDLELAARGTGDISATEAFGAWELAERHDLAYAAVLRTVPLEPGARRPPVLPGPGAGDDAPADDPRDAPWADLTGPDLHAALSREISAQVVHETRLSPGEIDPRRPLIEMGMDSVMSVRIRRNLERRLRTSLPSTLFWDHPTIDAVAELLAADLR